MFISHQRQLVIINTCVRGRSHIQQDLPHLYRVIILSDQHRLSLPVASRYRIERSRPAISLGHTHTIWNSGGKCQTIFVSKDNDPI
jgi:hypothetical protein